MGTVVEEKDFTKPVVRKKTLTAVNDASLATQVDFGQYGSFTFDEPTAHGGSDLGALAASRRAGGTLLL